MMFLFLFHPSTTVVFIVEHTVLETSGITTLIVVGYFNEYTSFC